MPAEPPIAEPVRGPATGGRVALVCGRSMTSVAVANRLRREFGDIAILVEEKESRKIFLKRRVRRLGLVKVAGQLAFMLLAAPVLRRRAAPRIAELLRVADIDTDDAVLAQAYQVSSVNSPEAIAWLQRERPSVVVVNGTRIISKRVLSATDAPFINTHCGITPEYRGSHGGYWALAAGDPQGCGVTVHLVDQGIDTGSIIAQALIEPTAQDNFMTYPYLQIGAALPELVRAVRAARDGELVPIAREARSGLWYHPTLWGYIATGIRRGIW